jgi:hypothetical protein
MRYWAGLYPNESKVAIEGVDILMKKIVNLLGTKSKLKKGGCLMI